MSEKTFGVLLLLQKKKKIYYYALRFLKLKQFLLNEEKSASKSIVVMKN